MNFTFDRGFVNRAEGRVLCIVGLMFVSLRMRREVVAKHLMLNSIFLDFKLCFAYICTSIRLG